LLSVQSELKNHGYFEGGKFHPADGSEPKDGFQATWEHFNGRDLKYPNPQYACPILMKPENFEWKETHGMKSSKVYRKHLGTLTERGVLAEMIRVENRANLTLTSADGVQMMFVYNGEGEVDGGKLRKESAIRLGSGQQATLSSDTSLEVLHFVLPNLEL
jgi:hypothetical protein